MAAQIPIKDNKEANDAAMANVRADKLREARAGHDGTWVAHPALASIAIEVFNKHMPTPNQMFVRREDVNVTGNDLLNMNMPGTVTEEGIRKNLNIGLGYMEGWLRGIGCVPINYLMVSRASRRMKISLIISSRRMPRLRRSAEASFGNGAGMASLPLKARRLTRRTLNSCSRSKPMNWPLRGRRETSSIWLPSTSQVKLPGRTMQTF